MRIEIRNAILDEMNRLMRLMRSTRSVSGVEKLDVLLHAWHRVFDAYGIETFFDDNGVICIKEYF